ncbi:ATP-GRASP peptide maturase of grasp-with-spasm system [Aquimarina sp. EL_43]|uniref:grasp-with-spasm system ATP-grasp peptide maturase n=1 Tax=unclassified Aquimarina TaxID=2627091 RepID=UPI0018CA4E13|nr:MULTISPECIES: grasp-with-spasm system ATP-grasp peptide maturase [unclassified Aquimarina]MBG6133455.1 ATP-GRASP peptide maturase of grasp-with-spasm system [Aquimarina sp. EL_35]MBG6153613.1 ATP-GRASP peptide maturase of grasp-with-spasm system [Aquimarina sp. EL_32]MBG6171769.1 ATP-GRASP peptide maturase of grasp-with-spasm system [Aquimarina sp. EL_43]
MILICKNYKEENESYEEVIDWLLYNNAQFEFFSGENFYDSGNDWSMQLGNSQINSSNKTNTYKSVWFRSFLKHKTQFSSIFEDINCTNISLIELRWCLSQEIGKINTQIFYNFKNSYQLPSPEAIKVDKFANLRLAKKIGLEIPDSLLTNSKKELLSFVEKHKEIIAKPLYEGISFQEKDCVIDFLTEKVNPEQLQELPSIFFPSFFQGYVEKDIELRVFYLEGKFYTMAMFSQLDLQTKTDFRNYNDERPNRRVPYLLPKEIEEKIIKFMTELKLNTGSIDLIKTPDKKYVFLEVNPTGQFGFTSKPCNYYLEDVIANTLIQHDR